METEQKTQRYDLMLERYEGKSGGVVILGERYMPYWHRMPLEDNEDARSVLNAGIDKAVECLFLDRHMPPRIRVSMNEGEKPVAQPVW